MKRVLKVFMFLLSGFVMLVAGAFLYVWVKYPPQKLESMALTSLQNKLHREVRIGGFSLNPFTGFKLSGFQLSDRPSFAQGTFIQCDSFYLRPSLLPLLRGRLAIGRIVLDSPVIHIIRNQDKTFNFSDLSENGSTPPANNPASPASAAPFLLTVGRLTIKNGQVLFSDHTDGSEMSLEEMNLTVDDFSMTRPFPVSLSVSAHTKNGDSTLLAPVTFSGTASLPFGLQGTFIAPSIAQTSYDGRDLKIQCDLKGDSADLSAMEGTAVVSMGQGEIRPGRLVRAITSAFDPSLSQITYDSLKAQVFFEKGVVRVEDGELHGPLEILAHGTYTAATDGLDFILNIKLPKSSIIPFTGWTYSAPIDVTIGGTLDHPVCHLKTSQMIGATLNSVKQHIGGAINTILKDSVGQIFNPH